VKKIAVYKHKLAVCYMNEQATFGILLNEHVLQGPLRAARAPDFSKRSESRVASMAAANHNFPLK